MSVLRNMHDVVCPRERAYPRHSNEWDSSTAHEYQVDALRWASHLRRLSELFRAMMKLYRRDDVDRQCLRVWHDVHHLTTLRAGPAYFY